jgi:hypothetical protein
VEAPSPSDRRSLLDRWNADLLAWPTITQFVPDEAYFVYGADQRSEWLRVEHLATALEVSAEGDSAIYLLNPQVVASQGEWEAWYFANWLPGAQRYRSFWDLMQAEYESFLQLRDTASR